MPLERRVIVDRSLAASEQEDPSVVKAMPRSGRRYGEPHTNVPSSHTSSRPVQPRTTNTQRPRTTTSQPARRTGDAHAQLHLPADDGREFYDYGAATDQLTLNRQPPRARTTSAYPTTTPPQTRPSAKQAAPTSRQKSRQDPVTQPAKRRVNWWYRRTVPTRFAIVLFSLLLLWTLGVNAYTGFVAHISDPMTYTQSAHKQEVTVIVDGKIEEAYAFINTTTNHVMLLTTPDDVRKSRIIVGPPVYGTDPTQLMLTIKVDGTKIITEIIAPRDVVDFVAPRQTIVPWTVDLAAQQKGGK